MKIKAGELRKIVNEELTHLHEAKKKRWLLDVKAYESTNIVSVKFRGPLLNVGDPARRAFARSAIERLRHLGGRLLDKGMKGLLYDFTAAFDDPTDIELVVNELEEIASKALSQYYETFWGQPKDDGSWDFGFNVNGYRK